jgi:hypothetical protein
VARSGEQIHSPDETNAVRVLIGMDGAITLLCRRCPNIAATPDGKQVWLTLKDVGKTMVFHAKPPFKVLKSFDTGPITNHVNFARNANGSFAYVTVGGLNEVKVFRIDDFSQVATIPVGNRTASGRPATAAGSMSGSKMPTASPRSTPSPTR